MEDSSADPGLSQTGAPRKSWHGVHKALADPLRVRLLGWLFQAPRSARQLADCAGLPADRLYYHLGQLEQAGLIEVAEYRPLARGKVERVYAPAETEPPGDDADPEETAAFLGSMLEATAMDITAAYQARRAGRRREVDLHRGALRLTDQALAELRGHIEQLAARFAEPGADGTWTRVVMALADLQDRPDADPPPGSPA
ncbi:MAG: winged helix-turn-helix domain-containing protein [Trebonia sp.]